MLNSSSVIIPAVLPIVPFIEGGFSWINVLEAGVYSATYELE